MQASRTGKNRPEWLLLWQAKEADREKLPRATDLGMVLGPLPEASKQYASTSRQHPIGFAFGVMISGVGLWQQMESKVLKRLYYT
jgi:hypothetical protein